MNQFQRYLLDEFVEDYRAGQMSRREFVMKVIGVSGGLAAAMGLFSSVGLSGAEIAAAQAAPRLAQTGPDGVTISPDDPTISVSNVSFPTADGSTLLGYMALPSAPGVVVSGVEGFCEAGDGCCEGFCCCCGCCASANAPSSRTSSITQYRR